MARGRRYEEDEKEGVGGACQAGRRTSSQRQTLLDVNPFHPLHPLLLQTGFDFAFYQKLVLVLVLVLVLLLLLQLA